MAFVRLIRKWLLSTLVAIGSILAIAMVLVSLLSPWYITNIDQSLPGLVYEIDRGTMPVRNDIAGISIPPNPYYPDGAPFLKIIAGMPGDVVSRQGRMFYVNGVLIAEAKEQTQLGNPLTLGPTGIIPPEHYFVWTPHRDSYDSRYNEIGWIPAQHILGVAWRLF